MTPQNLIWLTVFLPLAGFLFQALLGKRIVDAIGARLGRPLVGWVSAGVVFAAFAVFVKLTIDLAQGRLDHGTIGTLSQWITLQSVSIPLELRIDPLSMTMALVVTGVGALIHVYAIGYMAEDKDFPRFFTYLNLFIVSMLLLVLGNNLVVLFVGWEGVGVCSYLLIGFWYKENANALAANKAFITNRVGDVGLTIGMFLILVLVGQNAGAMAVEDGRFLSFDTLLANKWIFEENGTMSFWIAFTLFIGAMGKSAQFPLYVWLPDAMAGPTPVSALIHAATMVTSGVYLLNRMQDVFIASPAASAIVAVVGAITCLLGALIAFGQTDIKKVLAFSTVSQLGYMFIACGTGMYWVGIFHVITHAFFKALLFLGSGSVIHAMSHEQDMRAYGDLRKHIKTTWALMFVGWAAIAGFPLLSGFISKEAILAGAFDSRFEVNGIPIGFIVGGVGFLVALLTPMYMTRLMMLTFHGGKEQWKTLPHHGHGHHHDHDVEKPVPAVHGPDTHDFFMDDEELRRASLDEGGDDHHALEPNHKPHEVPVLMWAPLAVLAILSIVAGLLLYKGPTGGQLTALPLKEWLAGPGYHEEHKEHVIPVALLVGISTLLFAAGSFLMWRKYRNGLPENEGWDMAKWAGWRRSALGQFGVDRFIAGGSIGVSAALANLSAWFDRNFVDGLVNGVGVFTRWFGRVFRTSQTGYVRAYALAMLLGTLLLVGALLWPALAGGGY